jgi:hypothetical protein
VDVYRPIYPPPYKSKVSKSASEDSSDQGVRSSKSKLRPKVSSPPRPVKRKCNSQWGVIKAVRKKRPQTVYDKLALQNLFNKETVESLYSVVDGR